jgi:hypothetical protein
MPVKHPKQNIRNKSPRAKSGDVSPGKIAATAADSKADVLRRIFDVYYTFGPAGVLELYPDIIQSFQSRLDFIGPFDQNHGLRITKIVEAQHLEVGYGIQAVRINMIDVQPTAVFIDYNERRAVNLFLVLCARSGGYSFNQVRLAAAQRPTDGNNLTTYEL